MRGSASSHEHVLDDAIDMSLHDGIPASLREEEGHICPIVLEEILGQHGRTLSVPAHGQILWPPRLRRTVPPDLDALSLTGSSQAPGQLLAIGRSIEAHMYTPSSRIMPLAIGSGSIVMDGYKQHILCSELPAPLIDSPAPLFESDVGVLGDNPLGIEAGHLELFHDCGSNLPGVPVFPESPIRRPLAGSVGAMSVIYQDLHILQALKVDDESVCFPSRLRWSYLLW